MIIVIWCGAVVCLIALTTKLYEKLWNKGLSVEVFFDKKQIDEGQVVQIKERIENRKLLPLPTLTVKFYLDRNISYIEKENTRRTDKQYRNDCISIMPYQRVIRSFEAVGTTRGCYTVDEINLVAMDLLYRETLTVNYKNHTEMYVYPSRSRFARFQEIFNRMYGECLTNRLVQEDPFEFKGIRDYTGTDPMHKVNWKSSAKTGSLKVNQFYNTSGLRLVIFLNVEQTGLIKYEELVEESIRVTRNFIEEFVSRGIPVTLISNGVDKVTRQEICVEEGSGLNHIDTCLKQLARIDIEGNVRNMKLLLEEQHRNVQTSGKTVSLLISTERTKELAEAYLQYAGRDGDATWLIPIHNSTEQYLANDVREKEIKTICGKRIHMEYMIMERML